MSVLYRAVPWYVDGYFIYCCDATPMGVYQFKGPGWVYLYSELLYGVQNSEYTRHMHVATKSSAMNRNGNLFYA